jgi:putative tryptophan/tyrosine transport system substrate-binding protein
MKRREFIAGLGGAAIWPLAVRAQQGEPMRRVGVLMPFDNDDPDGQTEMAVLRHGLAERGWIEGRTIDVAVQWGDDPIEAAAEELVGAKPDVLLSRSTPTTAALNNERGLIPLVFVNVAEPAEHGLVESLSQPGETSLASPIWRPRSAAKYCSCLSKLIRRSFGLSSFTTRRRHHSPDCMGDPWSRPLLAWMSKPSTCRCETTPTSKLQ